MKRKCHRCEGLGLLYIFTFGGFGPKQCWDRCETCKGKGFVIIGGGNFR